MDRSVDFPGKSKARANVVTYLNYRKKPTEGAVAVVKSYVFDPMSYN
jgi:hypothetical protein